MPFDIPTDSRLNSVPDDYRPAGSERWFTLTEGMDAGKTLFYYDHQTGTEPPQATVLFVHGNPECSYTYRHARDALLASGANLRMLAVDHIGFGLSDQASFEMVDFHHAANLKQLIQHLDLQDVTLVVHDWGGPIGVGAFLDEMERVGKLVVMNTTVFPMPPSGITYTNWPLRFIPWSLFGKLVPNMFWGGIAASVLENGNAGSAIKLYLKTLLIMLKFALRMIPRNTPAWVFSEQFRSAANARSSKRNVLQTPRWGYGYRYTDPRMGPQDNHDFYQKIHDQLPRLWGKDGRNIPAAGHFGDYDPCGKESVIAQWCEALPTMHNHLRRYPGFGHFIEEYKGDEIAASILALNNIHN